MHVRGWRWQHADQFRRGLYQIGPFLFGNHQSRSDGGAPGAGDFLHFELSGPCRWKAIRIRFVSLKVFDDLGPDFRVECRGRRRFRGGGATRRGGGFGLALGYFSRQRQQSAKDQQAKGFCHGFHRLIWFIVTPSTATHLESRKGVVFKIAKIVPTQAPA